MDRRTIALENEILRGLVGSTAHGTNIEGTDDRDEMGVFIEPLFEMVRLAIPHEEDRPPHESYVYRTKPEGERSEPGDLDLTLYSLRHFVKLAAKGNPSVTLLLWLPEYITKTSLGQRLVDIRHAFISRDAGRAHLGFMRREKERLLGFIAKAVNRPELIEKHGYDTKAAGHIARLGLQGISLLKCGKLVIPMPEHERRFIVDIRNGLYDFDRVLKLLATVEEELVRVVQGCETLAHFGIINHFLHDAHRMHWSLR